MFYCPGEDCSKRDICLHHQLKNSRRGLQILDMSHEGFGYGGFDSENNYYSWHHEYSCGDNAPKYSSLWTMETWEDKCNFENYYNPAHAEGLPCPPGSLILIEDEGGNEKIIHFHPSELKLTTKVLDWHYWQRL